MIGYKKIFLIFLILLQCSLIAAQSRSSLEKQRNDIIKKIEETNQILKKTKDKKKSNTIELKAIEKQIENRKELIKNINSQKSVAEKNLAQLSSKNDSLLLLSENITKQYQKLLHTNYLTKLSNSKISYLLSSESINDLFLRWRYLAQFEDFTNNKLLELEQLSIEIDSSKIKINQEKEGYELLISDAMSQSGKLGEELKTKDKIVKNLQKEESRLTQVLAKNKKERERLNNEIEAIIIAELSKPKDTESSFNTNVSGTAKGKIPWPVEKGFISSKFGEQPHPTIKNIKITNNGIDISSANEQKVMAVMDGEVIGVTQLPGYNTMCIIKHGDLYSVYSKMKSANVQKKQNVKKGDFIGLTDTEDGHAILHFELWRDKTKVDPEIWLVKK